MSRSEMPIYVTQPYLPPLEEFIPLLERIWENKWVTNNGAFHQQLEAALAEYFAVPHVSLFANGTLALLAALRVLDIEGEVVTTPFSFVATAEALTWNGLEPVFADVDPVTLNLDPTRIEAAITARTKAILPVHVYGMPCDVDAIARIARDRGLNVIYDAAHAFGVELNGESLLAHGDLSVLSFHGTKVFNTFEGGAVVCHDESVKRRLEEFKNFGLADEITVRVPGLNAKMNEVQAAFGLLQFEHIGKILEGRRVVDRAYREQLRGVSGIRLPEPPKGCAWNFAYFPIMVQDEFPISRDELYEYLRANGFVVRRYFYPLISQLDLYRDLPSSTPDNLPEASEASRQVLCLPIYPGLSKADIGRLVSLIDEAAAR